MSTPAIATVAAAQLPAPGVWKIDPGHTEVAFIGRHFMLTKIRGRFAGVDGEVRVSEDRTASSVEVTIDMASVNSGDTARDEHLRSDDFFDVARHPTGRYSSSAVEWHGSSGRVFGDLTIKGISRPVTLDVDYLGQARDPWGNERDVFSASATINREDWGLTWNMALEAGGVVVSKEIRIEIEVETIRQNP